MTTLRIVVLFFIYDVVDSNTDYCQIKCDSGSIQTICYRKDLNCGAGPACGMFYKPFDLTNADRKYILDLHNYLRNKVATGFEFRGLQPPASNMKALSYSKELENIAKCWTNNCIYAHDDCRATEKYDWVGQNIGIMWFQGTLGNYSMVINNIIMSWYSEVNDFKSKWIKRFEHYPTLVAHYTQQVWAETTEIGCGMTFWVENHYYNYLFACNYGPGGNYLNEPIYKVGQPASECAEQIKNPTYPGLCGHDNLNFDL